MQLDLALIQFCKAQNTQERLVWSCCETYDSIDWAESNEVPKPSLKELEKSWEDYQKWKVKDEVIQQYKASIPSAEQQLQMILEKGLDTWVDEMHAIRKKHPFDNNNNIAPKMSKQIDDLKQDMNTVNANLDKTNLNTAEVKQLMKDINNGLLAIKGFMSMIAEIHQAVKANGSAALVDSQTKALD